MGVIIMPFCQNCGTLNEEGSNFCKQCGSKIIIENNQKEDNSDESNRNIGLGMILFIIFLGLILIFLIYAYGWVFLIVEILVIVILIIGHMFNGNG